MKNLEVFEVIDNEITDWKFDGASHFTQSAKYIFYLNHRGLFKYDFVTNASVELCSQAFENVICLKYLYFEEKVCIVCNKELYFVPVEPVRDACDTGIDFDVGALAFVNEIAAICWDPTDETAVMVSPSGNVTVWMFDYCAPESFLKCQSRIDANIPGTVYVGWGSQDTQFRGSEGKKKAEKPVKVKPIEDQTPYITFRGNNTMFAINYWKDDRREFIVFNSPCEPVYRSQDCPGLQPFIAWRPTGNMIATVTEVDDEYNVVIFEKNGEKRSEFPLNLGDVKIKGLQWSCNSSALAIHCVSMSECTDSLRIMMFSNYKMYEKQNLTFVLSNPLLHFDWHGADQYTLTLRVVTQRDVIGYVFRNVVKRNSGSLVGVIDGPQLLLTDFAEAVVSPPLCSREIQGGRSINFVAFDGPKVMVITTDYLIKVFDGDHLIFKHELNLKNFRNVPLLLHDFHLDGDQITFRDAKASYSLQNDQVNPISVDVTRPDVFLKDNERIFLRHSVNFGKKTYNFRMDASGRLWANETLICIHVSSFIVTDKYLIFTNPEENELYCHRLNENDLWDMSKMFHRSIEQGSEIVTIIPDTPKIVLQMPRGNIETIFCRLISIDILDEMLAAKKWQEALYLIRTEKLNSNLLIDLNPQRFMAEVDLFVEASKSSNELNALCLEFEETNVLETMYQNWGKTPAKYNSKTAEVFGRILAYFDTIDYAPYISTIMIITFHFFSLRHSLSYVQDLFKRSGESEELKNQLLAAVNTLKTYGCHDQSLFVEALLFYDLDLASFVASCCQMDPRVYEPQLDELRQLEDEAERRFRINMFAKKPEAAIGYLLRSPESDAERIATFIAENRLAAEAYERCLAESPHFQTVSRAFAVQMSMEGAHFEAGIIYKKAGMSIEALVEFRLGLRWREVIDLVGSIGMDDAERTTIIEELASNLLQRKMIKDSAVVYELYVKDYVKAINILTENECLEEAIHLAKKYKRRDILETSIIPALLKQHDYLKMVLGELHQSYEKLKTRLVEVRKSKAAKFEEPDDTNDQDLYSDDSTVTSRSSGSSYRSRSSTASSRHRRKQERKKQDLREGGIYEDIALIRALHKVITEIFSKSEEVKACCFLLVQESNLKFADIRVLHDQYESLVKYLIKGSSQIWPPHFYLNNMTRDPLQLADLENIEHLDQEYRTPPASAGFNNWCMDLFRKRKDRIQGNSTQ